jgi:hypothetical protein
MPIAAFIEAGNAGASKGQAMSPIALVLPKHDVHAAGARPVIYGLSAAYEIPKGDDGEERLLPEAALPLVEQYRHVTLCAYGSVDWTHEREWRWAYRGVLPPSDGTPPIDGRDLPGLDLKFTGMGVVVRTRGQAWKVLHDVLVRRDRGASGRYAFILVAEDVPSLTALRDPAEVQNALGAAAIDLEPFFEMPRSRRAALVAAFRQCVADVSRSGLPSMGREEGGCWLWIADPADEMTRALVLSGLATVNEDDRYLVRVDAFEPWRPLYQREELTRRLAAFMKARHGLDATYHSVLGSEDPDGIPHYSDPPFENRLHFNYGNDDADY